MSLTIHTLGQPQLASGLCARTMQARTQSAPGCVSRERNAFSLPSDDGSFCAGVPSVGLVPRTRAAPLSVPAAQRESRDCESHSRTRPGRASHDVAGGNAEQRQTVRKRSPSRLRAILILRGRATVVRSSQRAAAGERASAGSRASARHPMSLFSSQSHVRAFGTPCCAVEGRFGARQAPPCCGREY